MYAMHLTTLSFYENATRERGENGENIKEKLFPPDLT